MSSVKVRKFSVLAAALLASYLLFGFYHGEEKTGYVRLEKKYGQQPLILGELLPIAIISLAVVYCTREED